MSPEDVLVLPQNIDIHVVGVASPALRAHSCVLGTIPTLGFDVARFINKYQVRLTLGCHSYHVLSFSLSLSLFVGHSLH